MIRTVFTYKLLFNNSYIGVEPLAGTRIGVAGMNKVQNGYNLLLSVSPHLKDTGFTLNKTGTFQELKLRQTHTRFNWII